jgi:recombination protein RecT
MSKEQKNNKETAVEKHKPTVAERFVGKVQREFQGSVGHGVEFSDSEKQLASNLFIKIDSQLKQQEADRVKKNKKRMPFKWENVNMQKLSTDAVHLIRLGLDASIKNHVHVIPYLNGKTKQYDLNLQVGYKGKDYYRRNMATDQVQDIRYELVHETDEFKAIKKSGREAMEDYTFEITSPFDRGNIVGGFGYISYEDESKNKLVLVSEEEFKKVKKAAKASNIWNQWGEKMRYKTLVHRVTDELVMDPNKINPSYQYVEEKDNPFNPDNEVQLDQPEEREMLDFDSDPQPSNSNQEDGVSEDNYPEAKDVDRKQELLKEINNIGKQLHGMDWFQESKKYASQVNPDAETLIDLNIDQMEGLKATLEDTAKTEV